MDASTSQPETGGAKRYWDSFLKILPFIQWVVTIVTVIGVFAVGFRDSQTSQAQNIRDLQKDTDNLRRTIDDRKTERDKQMDEFKKTIVTKDLFEERTRAILDEQIRQRQILERLLSGEKSLIK